MLVCVRETVEGAGSTEKRKLKFVLLCLNVPGLAEFISDFTLDL